MLAKRRRTIEAVHRQKEEMGILVWPIPILE